MSSDPARVRRQSASIKTALKGLLKTGRTTYTRTFHAFDAHDLARAVREVGIEARDTVLVHSAFDAFEGFSGKPSDVITVLQGVITSEGAVMMPTLPFTGTAVAFAKDEPVFDVRRTPSRMGLLTELFRRSPGVVRSVHPTHPVAIWGKDQAALAEGHSAARTPCGRGSPYEKLLQRNGKILLLGTDIDVLTFYHAVEEMLESRFPVSPFTAETYRFTSKDANGVSVATETRLYEPAVSRRRNLQKLLPALEERGAWRKTRVGRMPVAAVSAREVVVAVSAMADRGMFCYD